MKQENAPSESELLILSALWNQPDATVHAVHEAVSSEKDVAYTTILTQLQRMHKKGLVVRTKQGKQHLYRAASAREEVESSLLNRLSNSIFGGSPVNLALRALGEKDPNEAEIEALQRWLDERKKQ